MKKLKLYILISIILLSSLINFSTVYAQQEIKVYVNNKLVTFDVSARNVNNRVLVPFRGILEALDAEVSWNPQTRTVGASKNGIDISLRIGSKTAYINGKAVMLDVAAELINDRTFIPIRFISEGLGADVFWDGRNNAVYITYPPIVFSYKGISLGSSSGEVLKTLGNPVRIDASEYGFSWHIYHKNYKDYIQIGVKDNVVVALYGSLEGWSNDYGIDIKTDKSKVEALLKDPLTKITKGNVNYLQPEFPKGAEEYYLYAVNGDYLTIFFDLHDNNRVTAFQIVSKAIEEAYIPSNYSTTLLRRAYESQLFDLANTARVNNGLAPLTRCPKADNAAYKHSYDMAANGYFSHENTKGESPGDRLTKEGIDYSRAGENIAAGQQNSIFAHQGLMNSIGHRNAILGNYESLGVGVAFGGPYKIYFTQKFYTAK